MSFLNSKKLKELESENEELKKLIDGFSEKEDQLKHFDELVKKARLDYAEIASKKDQTAEKLESLERDKAKLVKELNKITLEIKQLREMKITENNQFVSLRNALNNSDQPTLVETDSSSKSRLIISNEIQTAEKRKNEIALEIFQLRKKYETIENKITDGKKIVEELNTEIERKKEVISSLMDRKILLTENQNKNLRSGIDQQHAEELESRIANLDKEGKELSKKISDHKIQLDDLERQIVRKKIILKTQPDSPNENLHLELDIKIKAREAQLIALTEELKAKTELHREINTENSKVIEELKSGKVELAKLNESIEIETIRLTDLDYSLTILENEFDKLSKEISDKMAIREKIDIQLQEKNIQKVEFEDILKDLKETTTILAQLKNDIETGSGQSAKRFTGVLQYYSTMINDMFKKKSGIEKELIQKEMDLKDKQRLLDEKQSALAEMENILFVRHRRSGTIRDLTRAITEQREILEKSGFSFEDMDIKSEGIVNNVIPQQKLIEYENALKEIISSSDKYASDLITKRSSLEKEIAESKNRLNELNQNIRHSTSELSELKNSVSKIKIEHEDHRVSMNKLAAIKTKLEDQIDKYKLVTDKYINIKDKIREEQEMIKMRRDDFSSAKASKNINEAGKTFESHNPKWIKL